MSHHSKETDGSLPSLGLAGETSAGPSKPAPKETALVTGDAKHLRKPKEVHLPSFQALRFLDMASACLPSETWQQCTWKEMVTITMYLLRCGQMCSRCGQICINSKGRLVKGFLPISVWCFAYHDALFLLHSPLFALCVVIHNSACNFFHSFFCPVFLPSSPTSLGRWSPLPDPGSAPSC